MAEGLSSNYDDQDYLTDCLNCEVEDECCDEGCEGRIWVAPCGSINYANGEIANIAAFCEPPNITSLSHNPNYSIREKPYRGCKKSRTAGMPDTTFSLSFDICQGNYAHSLLLGRCSFDYIIAPKGRNLNFELSPSIFDQKTKVLWGRAVGEASEHEYPEDDCQTTSKTYLTNRYCWELGTEAELAA